MNADDLSIGADPVDQGLNRAGAEVPEFPLGPLTGRGAIRYGVFAPAFRLVEQLVQVALAPQGAAAGMVEQDRPPG
jgi:hypothetical protein